MIIKDNHFELDGKKFNIYSGAIHYFRFLPEVWKDRLTKLKLAGLNTVETYVCWNLHEEKEGSFNFEGRLDIVRFIKIAQEVGLYVILRPGPYICAEWDLGGLPAWLLAKDIPLRCNNKEYLEYVKRYFKELFKRVVPLQESNGGPIIAMQIENEYGNYGNDQNYLVSLKDMMIDLGVNTLLFTSDDKDKRALSGGILKDTLATVNFKTKVKKSFIDLELFQKNMPKMCTEFWCGWFDHYGEKHHKRSPKYVAKQVKEFLKLDANFNFYMFCGGTNFGFMAGANYNLKYLPTTTSYDYDALLTEWGGYTKKYHLVRDIMHKHLGIEKEELIPSEKFQRIGEVEVKRYASLLSNLDSIGTKHESVTPLAMEYLGQNQGMIYYETKVSGKYSPTVLFLKDLHDYAYIYLNDRYVKKVDSTKSNIFSKVTKAPSCLLPNLDGDYKLGILVDAMGHVNFNNHYYDKKGISRIGIVPSNLFNYSIYTLPLDNIDKVKEDDNVTYPLFFKGSFKATPNVDCFVYFKNFTKGVIYINGFNIGRYWNKGPAKALYLPGSLLKEENEIVILELENCKKGTIKILDKPNLG